MRNRCVTLPVFGLFRAPERERPVVDCLLLIPGVTGVTMYTESEVLEVRFDPARCGAAHLVAAIESLAAAQAGLAEPPSVLPLWSGAAPPADGTHMGEE